MQAVWLQVSRRYFTSESNSRRLKKKQNFKVECHSVDLKTSLQRQSPKLMLSLMSDRGRALSKPTNFYVHRFRFLFSSNKYLRMVKSQGNIASAPKSKRAPAKRNQGKPSSAKEQKKVADLKFTRASKTDFEPLYKEHRSAMTKSGCDVAQVIKIRQTIHSHAEGAFKEFKT